MNPLFDPSQRQLLLMYVLAASLSVVGQVLMKMALNQVENAASLSITGLLLRLGNSLYMYMGLALYAIAMVVFFKLLAQTSLMVVGFSLALGYVLLVFLAWAFLGESLTLQQSIGALLIVIGVLVINAR